MDGFDLVAALERVARKRQAALVWLAKQNVDMRLLESADFTDFETIPGYEQLPKDEQRIRYFCAQWERLALISQNHPSKAVRDLAGQMGRTAHAEWWRLVLPF